MGQTHRSDAASTQGQRSRSSASEETETLQTRVVNVHLCKQGAEDDSYLTNYDLVKCSRMILVSTHFTSPYQDRHDYHTHLHN